MTFSFVISIILRFLFWKICQNWGWLCVTKLNDFLHLFLNFWHFKKCINDFICKEMIIWIFLEWKYEIRTTSSLTYVCFVSRFIFLSVIWILSNFCNFPQKLQNIYYISFFLNFSVKKKTKRILQNQFYTSYALENHHYFFLCISLDHLDVSDIK